jgi:hypothetical protein
MAYRFMQAKLGRYSIREMAGLFGVSSGASYQWAKNGVSERRSRRDAELIPLIREIQSKHHNRYGSPRVREDLRRQYGKRVSRKKVAVAASLPLMRENGLNARTRENFGFHPASNRIAGFRRFLLSTPHSTFLSLLRLPLFGPSLRFVSASFRTVPLMVLWPLLTSCNSAIHCCMGSYSAGRFVSRLIRYL